MMPPTGTYWQHYLSSESYEEEEKVEEGGRRRGGEKEREDKSINFGRGQKEAMRELERNDKNTSCACLKLSKNK